MAGAVSPVITGERYLAGSRPCPFRHSPRLSFTDRDLYLDALEAIELLGSGLIELRVVCLVVCHNGDGCG